MTILTLYAVTAVLFLALDAVMLTFVMRPLFERHIGSMLLADIRIGAAAAFYLAYLAGLTWLVSLPALREGTNLQALVGGMVVGPWPTGLMSSPAMPS